MASIRNAGALLAFSFALAACGQSDVAMGEGAEEGAGSMVAQMRATCVTEVESRPEMASAATRICDCASERAREDLSVSDLMAGKADALEAIVRQCASEAMGFGTTDTPTSRTET